MKSDGTTSTIALPAAPADIAATIRQIQRALERFGPAPPASIKMTKARFDALMAEAKDRGLLAYQCPPDTPPSFYGLRIEIEG